MVFKTKLKIATPN